MNDKCDMIYNLFFVQKMRKKFKQEERVAGISSNNQHLITTAVSLKPSD
jgi:hypothetical protein